MTTAKEPSLLELKAIQKELRKQPVSADQIRKLRAIFQQILRHSGEAKERENEAIKQGQKHFKSKAQSGDQKPD